MRAIELYQAGKLQEAIRVLADELRNNPVDKKRRTFLFELLCFAGEYERAAKQLNVLAGENKDTDMGAMLYRSALHAERQRQEMFEKEDFPLSQDLTAPAGTMNGTGFTEISDADPRIGQRLELFAAGAYLWLPFRHIASIEIQPPKRLRDLLWVPALVRTGPEFRDKELGEVLIPALCPLSYKNADEGVQLGRATVWEELEDGKVVPYGQKMLLVDGEEMPLLEVRKIEFAVAATPAVESGE